MLSCGLAMLEREKLCREKYFDFAITKTPADGLEIATVGHFTDSELMIDYSNPFYGHIRVFAAPLIVPAKN